MSYGSSQAAGPAAPSAGGGPGHGAEPRALSANYGSGPGAESQAAQSASSSSGQGAEPAALSATEPGSGANPGAGTRDGALAFVESPVQLLNVLEWAHNHPAPDTAKPLTLVVLPPQDPMTRGQLRRMAELARDEGITVNWQEARDGMGGAVSSLLSLSRRMRRARTMVIGDPFSRYVQLLLALAPARAERQITVVDDGTATMEFVAQLASGERFVRWHRRGIRGGVRGLLFAPISRRARRRLTPRSDGKRSVEVFSSMPVEPPANVIVTANEFAWTRARFGPPLLTRGTDLVGTSLVETGVVDTERYLEAVASLTRAYGATRYFAHRRESNEKLQQVSAATGLEIVRPDLPLELVARRGPVGRTILSFPSTVVHTLPLALAGTAVTVAVCDIDPAWLTRTASPRAQGFLAGVTGTAHGARRLPDALPSAPTEARG